MTDCKKCVNPVIFNARNPHTFLFMGIYALLFFKEK